MKQLLDYFSRLGSKYHLNFSGQEILKDCILGFDGVNKKLLLLSGIGQGLYREQVIDLNEVSRCSVKKYYGRIKANALATASLDQYLEKMEVQMDFHNNKEAVVIPFYKPASSTLNELPQLEQKARRWKTLLAKLLPKNNICYADTFKSKGLYHAAPVAEHHHNKRRIHRPQPVQGAVCNAARNSVGDRLFSIHKKKAT